MQPPTFSPVYAYLYPVLCEIARSHGYALALHGSMQRDFDLIAVPWTDEASQPSELVDAVCNAAGGKIIRLWAAPPHAGGSPTPKHHGRMAWTIVLDYGAYIDLSVMPLLPLHFDLAEHLERQRAFSLRAFGPGPRTDGVLDHILKEIEEIRKAPTDLKEWIDLIILGFDGALRLGGSVKSIIAALVNKQRTNEGRRWPDWRTAPPAKAITHIKDEGQ